MFDFWNNKEIRLPVDKLQNVIKESREIRELDKNFFRSVSELRNNLSRLYDSISALNSKTTENKYSNIVKNKFCARSMELLNGVEYPESIVTAEDFCDTLRDKLDELASLNIKEFRHLNAFKEEMKSVAEGIKIAGNNVNTIGQILNYPVSKRAAEVWKTIEEMKNLESAIADMENQINSINSRIDETEKILKMNERVFIK
jgi:chromosome segregation ATPase